MTERTAVIHEGLRALIQRESAQRVARLGATEPSLRVPPEATRKNIPTAECQPVLEQEAQDSVRAAYEWRNRDLDAARLARQGRAGLERPRRRARA